VLTERKGPVGPKKPPRTRTPADILVGIFNKLCWEGLLAKQKQNSVREGAMNCRRSMEPQKARKRSLSNCCRVGGSFVIKKIRQVSLDGEP